VHGRRLGAPGGEAVGVDGELVLHAADDGAVGVEEDLGGGLVLAVFVRLVGTKMGGGHERFRNPL
jgi:hypothetical protein